MLIRHCRLLALLLLALLVEMLVGCSMVPPLSSHKDNVLTLPVTIEEHITKEQLVELRSKFMAEAINGYQGEQDEYARKKIENIVNARFDSAVLLPDALENRYRLSIIKAFGNPSAYIKSVWPSMLRSTPTATVHIDQGTGTGTLSLKLEGVDQRYGTYGIDKRTGTVSIDAIMSYKIVNDTLTTQFNTLSYSSRCAAYDDVMKMDHACVVNTWSVKDENLAPRLNDIKILDFDAEDVASVSQSIKSILGSRYVTRRGSWEKKEIVYPIDSTTAKSRLQRSLNAFAYDEKRAAFVFSKTHNFFNEIHNFDNASVTHSFSISLFPEKNGTAVVFDGTFDYVVDTFSGKNDSEAFAAEMASQISAVDKIFGKQ